MHVNNIKLVEVFKNYDHYDSGSFKIKILWIPT